MKTLHMIAALFLISPFTANAGLIQITATPSTISSNLQVTEFIIVYDDVSDDGLFQFDELVSFSGVTVFVASFPSLFQSGDGLFGIPEISGISEAGGLAGPGNWRFTNSGGNIFSLPIGDPWGASNEFWTYSSVSVSEVLLEQLGTAVTDVGSGKSLADKIDLVQTYLAVPDVQSACAMLNAFQNQVRAQWGKKLTTELADQLTADAEAIEAAIGCD